MVFDLLGRGHRFQPVGGGLVLGNQQGKLGGVVVVGGGRPGPVPVLREGGVDALGRCRQGSGDFSRQGPGFIQPRKKRRVRGMRRIIQQQNHLQGRELLEGRGPQGGAHHLRFFGVGGHQDRDGVRVVGEVAVELAAGNPLVVPEAVKRALPCHEVHQRRKSQEGYDNKVGNGLELKPETRIRVVGQLFQDC